MKTYLKKEIKTKRRNCQLSHCISNAALEVAGPVPRTNNSVSCLILHMAIFRNIMGLLVLPTLLLSCMLSCTFVGCFLRYRPVDY